MVHGKFWKFFIYHWHLNVVPAIEKFALWKLKNTMYCCNTIFHSFFFFQISSFFILLPLNPSRLFYAAIYIIVDWWVAKICRSIWRKCKIFVKDVHQVTNELRRKCTPRVFERSKHLPLDAIEMRRTRGRRRERVRLKRQTRKSSLNIDQTPNQCD